MRAKENAFLLFTKALNPKDVGAFHNLYLFPWIPSAPSVRIRDDSSEIFLLQVQLVHSLFATFSHPTRLPSEFPPALPQQPRADRSLQAVSAGLADGL